MAVLISSDRNWATRKNKDEWLIQNKNELQDLPETTGPGSIAYTADLMYMAQMDETGTWKEIGGDE